MHLYYQEIEFSVFRKNHRIHSDNRAIKSTSNGLISSASAHQFYQSQRSVNYYHNTTVSTPRSHMQNYQNKRRYLSGNSFICNNKS